MEHQRNPRSYSRWILLDSTSDIPDVLWSHEIDMIGPGVYGFPELRTIVVCFRNHDVAAFVPAVTDVALGDVAAHLAAQLETPVVGDRVMARALVFEVSDVEPDGNVVLAIGGKPSWIVPRDTLRDLLLRGVLTREPSAPDGDTRTP